MAVGAGEHPWLDSGDCGSAQVHWNEGEASNRSKGQQQSLRSLFKPPLLPLLCRRSFFCQLEVGMARMWLPFHSARVCAFRRSGVVCLEGQPSLPVMLTALNCLFRSASLRGRVAPGARGTGAGCLPCRGGLQRTMGQCWELDCPLSSSDR